MKKMWRFILGLLSVLCLFSGILTIWTAQAIGFFFLIGGVILWPSIVNLISTKTRISWLAPVAGLVCALIVGPVIQGAGAGPTEKNESVGASEEKAVIDEEKRREAQEWWQNRQENLRAEHAREASEWEAKTQKELKREHKQCFDDMAAYTMSKRFVQQALKAPHTAKFPSFHADGVSVRSSGRCKFTVSAYVDSQNSFGAMLRTNYSINMEYLPTEKAWQGSNLKM